MTVGVQTSSWTKHGRCCRATILAEDNEELLDLPQQAGWLGPTEVRKYRTQEKEWRITLLPAAWGSSHEDGRDHELCCRLVYHRGGDLPLWVGVFLRGGE